MGIIVICRSGPWAIIRGNSHAPAGRSAVLVMSGPLPAPSVDASTETVYVLSPTSWLRVIEVLVLLTFTVILF